MEKMRSNMVKNGYHTLERLGRSKPGRGMVSEDLGRTKFKTSSTTNGKSSKRSQDNLPDDESDGNTTSEDDLNLLKHGSSLTLPSRAYKKSKAPKNTMSSAEFHVTPPPRVKPRPIVRVAKPPDIEENEANSSLRKPLDPFNSTLHGNSMPPSNQLALQRPQRSLSRENSQSTSPLEELNPNQAKRPKKSKGKREPGPFPMQDDYRVTKSELKSRSPNRGRRDPAPFPMAIVFPSHSPRKRLQSGLSATSSIRALEPHCKENTTRVLQRFPLDTLSTHPQCTLSDEDDENENDELALTDNDSNTIFTYGGPRPFPMAMSQCLPESTHQTSGSKRSAKNNNEQRANKRSRPSPEPDASGVFSSLVIGGDGDDAASLCPYCDEPWPSSPSLTLVSLLECTKRKSYIDPRPGNALGLKAPLAVFAELCQRHRFEMTHLPLAVERGWPTRLDFASLPNRIKGFRKKIGRFINHPNESKFWREVRDDVKEVGRMKVVSVSGQYATFERTQPGYYGEQGSIIIHQTLYSLFPSDDIPLTPVDPLTPDQFLTRVLVPETAVLLIQDDMHLTKEEALRVLDESKKYGVAMFPEQSQGEEAAEVGEQLAKERAKERRKLLEERGEADADVQRQVERERRLARKAHGKDEDQPAPKGKGKGRGRAKESESDASSDKGKDPEKGTRKSKLASTSRESSVKVRPMRLNESGGPLMLDDPGQLTPRPSKEQTRESSIISWRSKRSPSTSPDTRPPKPTSRSSSLYKSSRNPISSPPKPPTQENHQDSQWVFDLRNVSPSPDHEDGDFDEIPGRYEGNPKARESANEDSDVVFINDDSTEEPTPKPKSRRIIQRSIIDNSSDSEATTQKATRKPKAAYNQKAEKSGDQAIGVGFGQTKRKKKGATKDKLVTSGGIAHRSLDNIKE